MKAGEKHRTRHRPHAEALVSVPAAMTKVACPVCGHAVDLWSGEEETRCFACDHEIFKKQQADC
jgi:DNA-directed RNA polymerase subunit RPC12/RpoP